MTSRNRRANARRRAWGRGPIILRFEPLEGRQLLSLPGGASTTSASATDGKPDLVAVAFDTLHNLDWGQSFSAVGTIQNRGDAAAPAGTQVDVYAAPLQGSVQSGTYVGTITIPTAIEPGSTATFNQAMHAPPVPIIGLNGSNSYELTLSVDPLNKVAESVETNNANRGVGFDTSYVTITPKVSANLEGVAFAVSSNTVSWGDKLSVSGRLFNDSQGGAPATRARVVLSPAGEDALGPDAVTLGDIQVPPVGAWQSVNVTGQFTLPTAPPSTLAGASQLQVTLVPDASFQTRTPLSVAPEAGAGLDSATVQVSSSTTAPLPAAQRPDLSVQNVQVSSKTLTWSQPFQVSTTLLNSGASNSGPFHVRFLLVDDNHPSSTPLALADATIPGIQAGYTQQVVQTVNLEGPIPSGLDLASVAGRIVVVVDSENGVDEVSETNNSLTSSPLTLKLLDRDGVSTPVTPTPTTTSPGGSGNTSTGSGSNTTGGTNTGGGSQTGTSTSGTGSNTNTSAGSSQDSGQTTNPRTQPRLQASARLRLYIERLQERRQAWLAARSERLANLRIYNGGAPRRTGHGRLVVRPGSNDPQSA